MGDFRQVFLLLSYSVKTFSFESSCVLVLYVILTVWRTSQIKFDFENCLLSASLLFCLCFPSPRGSCALIGAAVRKNAGSRSLAMPRLGEPREQAVIQRARCWKGVTTLSALLRCASRTAWSVPAPRGAAPLGACLGWASGASRVTVVCLTGARGQSFGLKWLFLLQHVFMSKTSCISLAKQNEQLFFYHFLKLGSVDFNSAFVELVLSYWIVLFWELRMLTAFLPKSSKIFGIEHLQIELEHLQAFSFLPLGTLLKRNPNMVLKKRSLSVCLS